MYTRPLPYLLVLLCLLPLGLTAQDFGQLDVVVADSLGTPLPETQVRIKGSLGRYETDEKGHILIKKLPVGRLTVTLRRPDYQEASYTVLVAKDSTTMLQATLSYLTTATTTVTGRQGLPDIDKAFDKNVGITGDNAHKVTGAKNDESLIVQAAGGITSSEFSSQYRVRGGNYDENLIYLNGIEMYRPQIVRSGQMEGLGIVNTRLIERVTFNTGGFPAQYADKLSSVMNVTYADPDSFRATAELGMVTASLSLQGRSSYRDSSGARQRGGLTYLVGARGFSMRYLLGSLDTDGSYQPLFWDVQSLISYVPQRYRSHRDKYRTGKDGQTDTLLLPTNRLRISLLTVVQRNDYRFFPQSRETTFGTIQSGLRLFVGFEGKEQTTYLTGQSALILDHKPSLRLSLRYTLSGVRSEEAEIINVEAGYRLADVNTNFGDEKFNEVVFVRGVGTELRYARNYLTVNILRGEHEGSLVLDRNLYKKGADYFRHRLLWGLRVQNEQVDDQFEEWAAVDSAEFSEITELVGSRNHLNSTRLMGYLQHNWRLGAPTLLLLGARAHHWNLNGETFVSPRLQLVYDASKRRYIPDTLLSSAAQDSLRNKVGQRRRYQLRASLGSYYQPAFYREMRDFDGSLNTQRPAQSSYQFIAGGDYIFTLWGRDFNLFLEGYAKYMPTLYPYEFENVRVRYYPDRQAEGYGYGADLRLNGQFIPETESWINISYLSTKERVDDLGQGWVRRPTDQRILVSFFFQDELPILPSLKMHINLIYGSGMPHGPPGVLQNRTVFQMPFYNRVDLGISNEFKLKQNKSWKPESLWVGLDVYNLFGRPNTVSYLWIKDVYNTRFAVPNYLSVRLLNVRVVANF